MFNNNEEIKLQNNGLAENDIETTNELTKELTNETVNKIVNETANELTNELANETTNEKVDGLINETVNEIANGTVNESVNEKVDGSVEFNVNNYIIHDETTNTYQCAICKRNFKTLTAVKAHISMHDPSIKQCPICGQRIKNVYKYNQHLKKHQSAVYKCNHCLQVFTSEEDLRAHLATHMIYNMNKKSDYDVVCNPTHLKKGFTCNHCNKEFIDRKDFYHHVLSIQNLIPDCPTNHFHLEMSDKFENKYYAKCAICGNKFFDIKTHLENYHHVDYQVYLEKWDVEDYSDLPTMNPAYSTPRNRVFFNLKPNKEDEDATDVRKRRNEMNQFESNIKKLLPYNVIFADTKFYVPVHENKKMTQLNPDFIVVDKGIIEQVQHEIDACGFIHDPALYKQITKVIECFGDYWHSQKFTGLTPSEHEKHIKALYAQAGFQCLVIWEHELENVDVLKEKINSFVKG